MQLLAAESLLPAAIALSELKKSLGVRCRSRGDLRERQAAGFRQALTGVHDMGRFVAADFADRLGRQVGRIGLDQ